MSSLELIRSLRRALADLRDAQDPSAVNQIARTLASELEVKLGEWSSVALIQAFEVRAHDEAQLSLVTEDALESVIA